MLARIGLAEVKTHIKLPMVKIKVIDIKSFWLPYTMWQLKWLSIAIVRSF